jgi:hypothetical protein
MARLLPPQRRRRAGYAYATFSIMRTKSTPRLHSRLAVSTAPAIAAATERKVWAAGFSY